MNRALLALSIAVSVCQITSVSAADYPTKPVRVVVPTAAGGTTDIVARMFTNYASAKSGARWIVENRPGATGTVGMDSVVRADPDGYTLGFNNTGILISPLLRKDTSFDALNDLVAVGPLAEAPVLLVVNGDLPVRSLRDFIALVKANPGKFNYASAGVGSTQHLASDQFARIAGLDMVHVPYRGTPQAVTDLLQGGVQMISVSLGQVAGFIESKKVRILAAATEKRIPSLPDIPTAAEAGLPGYLMTTWFGLFAPRGTPQPIVAQLSGYIADMHKTAEGRKMLSANSMEPMEMSSDQFRQFLEKDRTAWARVVREAGIDKQ